MKPSEFPALREFWYPLMRETELDSGPVAQRLLGVDLVLWRDATGAPAAALDRCPHRTAKLSKGFVENGTLVCGYHGWAFGGDGKCLRVPQRADPSATGKLGVRAFRAKAYAGHVWVALEPPRAEIPVFAEDGDPAWRRIPEFAENWACGALRLMENEFDNAHIEFVHQATFGNTRDPAPAENAIEEFADGFVARSVVRAANRAIGADYTGLSTGATTRTTTHRWWLPFLRKLDLEFPNGLRHRIVTATVPVDDTTTRLVQWVYRNDTEADVPAEKAIAFDRAVTLEDKALLETVDPFVPLRDFATAERHMPSDRPGLIMRRMLLELAQSR
jgi:phenylpropionate dioxygenase-like ring-hydroxylating dioxygenase large terminal subunit